MVSWRLLRRWKSRVAARLTPVRSSSPAVSRSPPLGVLFESLFASVEGAEEVEVELVEVVMGT